MQRTTGLYKYAAEEIGPTLFLLRSRLAQVSCGLWMWTPWARYHIRRHQDSLKSMTTGCIRKLLVFTMTYRVAQANQIAPIRRVEPCKPKKITKQKRNPKLGIIMSSNMFLFSSRPGEKPKWRTAAKLTAMKANKAPKLRISTALSHCIVRVPRYARKPAIATL